MTGPAQAMAMRAEVRQAQAQVQRLSLTPLMRQSLKVLQMPTGELESYLLERALDNPLIDLDALSAPDDLAAWRRPAPPAADGDPLATAHEPSTFKDSLLEQLPGAGLGRREEEVCRWLIDCLDQRGYLPADVRAERVGDAALRAAFQRALSALQSFEPAGVGARSLEECLLLQLNRLSEDMGCCREIVTGHLDDLARNRVAAIAKALRVPRAQVEEGARLLRELCPIPSRGFETRASATLVRPEAIVAFAEDGSLEVRLVSPWSERVRLDAQLARRVECSPEPDRAVQWLSEGRGLRAIVRERESTLLAVIRAVAERQVEAIAEGMDALVPLTMGEVARELELSESTVSRAVRDKWILVPYGMVELRAFFSSVAYAQEAGGISAESAKARLRELLAAEDPRHPLSDQRLVDLLAQDGIILSRRVVAKYRDAMGIPASSVRRRR